MLQQQQKLNLSNYWALYDLLVPKNHLLRLLNELVDFSFVECELKDKYCLDNGRNAISPIQMFKYLLLKTISSLSDEDLIERCRYDLSYKYFLQIAPEDDVIHPSSLSKFRKLRLKDENILDLLIAKSLTIATEKGILKGTTLYLDATHIHSRYRYRSKREFLLSTAKKLRHSVYSIDEEMKGKFCEKPKGKHLDETICYCQSVMDQVRRREALSQIPSIKESLNYLEEVINDIAELEVSNDPDAKVGHKSSDSSFFGYKAHLAMTKERLIAAAVLSPGNTTDGPFLMDLVEKSMNHGVKVNRIVGDGAYGIGPNLRYIEELKVRNKTNDIKLVAPLMVSETHETSGKEGYEFNKDASMYQCPAGHLSIEKRHSREYKNKKGYVVAPIETYFFDIEHCKSCQQRKGCYKEGSKSKSYSVSKRGELYQDHQDYQNSKEYEADYKNRYQIESKNSELKNVYQCARAIGTGLFSVQLQSAAAIFISNMKRIIKLMDEKDIQT